jgi:hypothetical protein
MTTVSAHAQDLETAACPPARELAHLEAVIADGQRAVFAAAQALEQILSAKLYRQAGYRNFETYCRQRWGLSRTRAYQLVDLSKVRRLLPVENESQARRLAPKLKADPGEVVDAFEALASMHGPKHAIRTLAKRREEPQPIEESDACVFVVAGLPFGIASPVIRVTKSFDRASTVRAELEEANGFRKVIITPCEVEHDPPVSIVDDSWDEEFDE